MPDLRASNSPCAFAICNSDGAKIQINPELPKKFGKIFKKNAKLPLFSLFRAQ